MGECRGIVIKVVVVETGTEISAPIDLVFDLARSVFIHTRTTAWTRERVVESTAASLGLGDVVTFEARHFGKRRRLTARITEFDRPTILTDEQVQGPFKLLRHARRFESDNGVTRITEQMTIVAPFGPLGWLIERSLLKAYLGRFLKKKNRELKRIAEAQALVSENSFYYGTSLARTCD